MNKNCKFHILLIAVVLSLSSCSTFLYSTFPVIYDVNRLELGMTKVQVDSVLRVPYIITEKRMEDGDKIEILSYKYNYMYDEFYFHLLFKNGKLEEWHKELLPRHETIIKKEM